MKEKIFTNEIYHIVQTRKYWNEMDLEDIELCDVKGKQIKITDEEIKEWKCTGLDNFDFLRTKMVEQSEDYLTKNVPHKIIARYCFESIKYNSYGKIKTIEDLTELELKSIGNQWKKKEYISTEKFNKYSPKLIKNWNYLLKYKIEIYIFTNNKWISKK